MKANNNPVARLRKIYLERKKSVMASKELREILELPSRMKPGRELDALVAEKVIGLPKELISINGPFEYKGDLVREIEYYSTNISAAWEVVEKLAETGAQIRLSNKAQGNRFWWAYIDDGIAQGDTLPHAICLAALMAKARGLES